MAKSLVLVVVVVAEKIARAVDVLRRCFCMGMLWIVDWGLKEKKDSAHFLGCCVMLVFVGGV